MERSACPLLSTLIRTRMEKNVQIRGRETEACISQFVNSLPQSFSFPLLLLLLLLLSRGRQKHEHRESEIGATLASSGWRRVESPNGLLVMGNMLHVYEVELGFDFSREAWTDLQLTERKRRIGSKEKENTKWIAESFFGARISSFFSLILFLRTTWILLAAIRKTTTAFFLFDSQDQWISDARLGRFSHIREREQQLLFSERENRNYLRKKRHATGKTSIPFLEKKNPSCHLLFSLFFVPLLWSCISDILSFSSSLSGNGENSTILF